MDGNQNIPVEYSPRTAKEIIISQLKTGNLVKIKSEILPIIYHYGIVCRERDEFMVYHNDPEKINQSGGNIVREDFMDWISGRQIVEFTESNLDMDDIESVVQKLATQKYNLISFNCEHFITGIQRKKIISEQVMSWGLVLTTIGITYLILRKWKN